MQSELLTPSNERMLQGWKNKGFNEERRPRARLPAHGELTDWDELRNFCRGVSSKAKTLQGRCGGAWVGRRGGAWVGGRGGVWVGRRGGARVGRCGGARTLEQHIYEPSSFSSPSI